MILQWKYVKCQAFECCTPVSQRNIPKNCVKIRVKKLRFRETLYCIVGGRGLTRVSMLKTRRRNYKSEYPIRKCFKQPKSENMNRFALSKLVGTGTVSHSCQTTYIAEGSRTKDWTLPSWTYNNLTDILPLPTVQIPLACLCFQVILTPIATKITGREGAYSFVRAIHPLIKLLGPSTMPAQIHRNMHYHNIDHNYIVSSNLRS